MDAKKAVENLRTFIGALVKARIKSKKQFRNWKKKPANEKFMAKCLGYRRKKGMPAVTALVEPHFHKELPLIGLNYTNVAHNTLHAFPDGWTPAIRHCRGIIFDRRGHLMAFPFPKFFNHGEHPETLAPPGPFVATEKHDGHLGIVFTCRGELHLATRVTFDGPSAMLGNEMLQRIVEKQSWLGRFPEGVTMLVEIIHPRTRVHLDYGGREGFTLIGAYRNGTHKDFTWPELLDLGAALSLPVAERWEGTSLDDLKALVRDTTVRGREGLVARFANGVRVKYKFETYIGLMVAAKLTYGYLMKRLMAHNAEKMIRTLPEEIVGRARDMIAQIQAVVREVPGDLKARREYLYRLDSERQKKQHYRSICRKFIQQVEDSAKPRRRKTAQRAA